MNHAILTLIVAATTAAASPEINPKVVDFRYMPPEWQTAICLPDDPHKTLVDKSGELLYNYLGRRKEREFAARIGIQVDKDAIWTKQELLSPRIPIVRTCPTTGPVLNLSAWPFTY